MSMSNMDDLLRIARDFIEKADENALNNPTSDNLQVVIVEPMKKPYKKIIPNTLTALQQIVDGYIENIFIGESKRGARFGIIVNEEGKLRDLPFNRSLVKFDILVGTFLITAYNLQGDNVSLTDDEADKFIRQFSSMEVYL